MIPQDLITTVFLDPATPQGMTAFATPDLIALRCSLPQALLTDQGDHLRLVSRPNDIDIDKILPNRIALLALITLLDQSPASAKQPPAPSEDADHWLTTHLHHLRVIPALLWLSTTNRHVHLVVTPSPAHAQLRIKLAYHPTKNIWLAYTVRNTTLTPFKAKNCVCDCGAPQPQPPTDLPALRAFVEHHLTLQFLCPLVPGGQTPDHWLIILKDDKLLTHDWTGTTAPSR